MPFVLPTFNGLSVGHVRLHDGVTAEQTCGAGQADAIVGRKIPTVRADKKFGSLREFPIMGDGRAGQSKFS